MPCKAGDYLNDKLGCLECKENTYSKGGFEHKCKPCPHGKGVKAGMGYDEHSCKWCKSQLKHWQSRVGKNHAYMIS